MKHSGFLLAAWLLFAPVAAAGTLTDAEASGIRQDITEMMSAFEAGDESLIIQRTHHSLPSLMGGRAAFEQVIRLSMQQLREAGVRFLGFELGAPTATYRAGAEEVCFVPRLAEIEIGGKRIRSASFMIAVRDVGGSEWTYLDGAGLREHPNLLHQLLPELEPGITMPPNTMEVIADGGAQDRGQR